MTPRESVLLVDDDDDILKNIAIILELHEFEVRTATDGASALALLQDLSWTPSVILSDIAMPGLNGFQLLEAVKMMPTLQLVPFIFLSAQGTRLSISEGRKKGVDDYIVKPFDPKELIAAIRHRLDRVHALQTQTETNAAKVVNNVRSFLIQMLSHELRTPLTYITGGFELLTDTLRAETASDDMAISIDLIRSGTARLTRLAEQVVRFTELMTGGFEARMGEAAAWVSLVRLVDLAASLVTTELAEQRTTLQKDYHLPPDAEVWGVSEYLVAALIEILRNAIVYSAPDVTLCLRLELDSYPSPPNAILRVIDHGRGIAPEHLEKVWEVMVQPDRKVYEQQGFGLGLPIVYHTLRAHGGTAQLESAVGVGTTVTLTLPLRTAEQAAEQGAGAAP